MPEENKSVLLPEQRMVASWRSHAFPEETALGSFIAARHF
jgi:hypothetical protein